MHFREYRGDSGEVLFWGDWGGFGEEVGGNKTFIKLLNYIL